MAVSLKDISQRTHINICSVSQVLNNHPKAERLRQETRDKILLAAKELGYCRNEAAATIRKKRSNVLAFVTSEMGSIEYTMPPVNVVIPLRSTALPKTVRKLWQANCLAGGLRGSSFTLPNWTALQKSSRSSIKNPSPGGRSI